MGLSGLVRTAMVVALAAVALVGVVAAPASAASPTLTLASPSPAEGATLTRDSVAFEFYTSKPQARGTLVCSLSGPTSATGPCDAPVAAGAQGSRSGMSYGRLANGSYTFTVSLALSGGGTATATRHFSVAVPVRQLYWTNAGTDTIGRANLDGTGANQSFIDAATDPRGVAVDANHVYWTNTGAGTIGRANLDGTDVNQSFIDGADAPNGVAVDANHVYWTNHGTNAIGRAKLDGTGVNQSFIDGATAPQAVAVDANHVYWTNARLGGTIGRANLDGTGVNQSFITGAGIPIGVAVDANHVYWTNAFVGVIGRAKLDGTGVNQSFIDATSPRGVAVDANHVYWTNINANTIGRAKLDGTDVNESFIDATTDPVGVAVAADNRAPSAAADSHATDEDTPLELAAPGVLANDSDPDGDALTAVLVSGPAHGTLTLDADGSLRYTPDADYNGHDSFSYLASDGTLDSDPGTVTIEVRPIDAPAPPAGPASISTPPPGPAPPAGSAASPQPAIAQLRLSPRCVRPSRAGRVRIGMSLRMAQPGPLQIRIDRAVRGGVWQSCPSPNPQRRFTGRFERVATLSQPAGRRAAAALVVRRVTLKLKLSPGLYRITVRAQLDHNRPSRPARRYLRVLG